ncbi:hypothetical protein [Streptomyces mirabilis]
MTLTKIVMQVKLVPDATQASAVGATLHTVNDRANWVIPGGRSRPERAP